MKKILISALEPSANLHLEEILKELQMSHIFGIFDESFGVPLISSKEFSVMGFIDVLPKILFAKKAIKSMIKLSFECDVALLIDSPAFNIPLAKALKKANPNIKIIYYILPKVWVWKEYRAKIIEEYCDEIVAIFPFELKYYTKAKYFGNPLLDEIKTYRDEVKNSNYVAFMAGSRKSEIEALMPLFREVIKNINKKGLLIIPKSFTKVEIDELYGDISDFEVVQDTTKGLMMSEFAFICSGTATLESAIIGTPFVLVYKAKAIDYMIAKMFLKIKYIGLANIILDFNGLESISLELIQNDLTISNLLNAYNSVNREVFLKKSKTIRDILKGGCAKEIANLLR